MALIWAFRVWAFEPVFGDFAPLGVAIGAVNLDIGEYVIKKSSVDKYGKGLLDMINDGKIPAKKMKSLLG